MPKDITKLRVIKLIASDFDSLDLPSNYEGTEQYYKNNDCPISRAIKRITGQSFTVYPDTINVYKKNPSDYKSGIIIYINGSYEAVEKCRLELQNGAKSASITVLKN